ncbi:FecCD family ABC transporter permease [Photobacterium leiognathi]|uniref:FecCD family ABC transporter permease n=1 Tax=Photobacterium leiognathi TaxID=553611 RepID=UPI0002088049|nr:iron ABC transporter permease [Photobacterium leiognathi]PSW53120.1 iron ABC transporter permease [Photobacterium leiognathi subsp. mandapamensis]GAA04320.1 fecCD transport family protein [Photobacterium leiognathi subsp. mandapamensis svers.1.1.]
MYAKRFSAQHIYILSIGLLVLAGLSSIVIGPMAISYKQSLLALIPGDHQLAQHVSLVIHQIRLPRTLLCFAIGAILAICGSVLQGLFRNPLADPGIIGITGGAGLGAALAIVLFAPLTSTFPQLLNFAIVPVFAFIGGAISTVMVYRLGTDKNGTSVMIMLLAGVAITAISAAGLGLLNYVADDEALRDLSLWSMGSLAGATWSGILHAYCTLALLFSYCYRHCNNLNAFLLGEAEARHMGVNTQHLKRNLIIVCAAGVGITVSICGPIGFIGLVIPHVGRMLTGPNHKTLLPISALLGGLILLVADMIARSAFSPQELPVGIITAILGAPFFIYLLSAQKRHIS